MKLLRNIAISVLFLVSAGVSGPLRADEPEPLPENLTEIGLGELMNLDLRITSATRRSQKVSTVPAAVYVITGEEVRRSGVRHVAEVLRLAPGVEVARINSNTWAVSIRGLNQQFSYQILVLLDGKSVFTPLFSGTFWETIDLHFDTIERIEVIRGPGASVWGANAVNGVINIITKNSAETQGTTVSSGGGSAERYFHSILHGGEISEDHTYRLSHQFTRRAANKLQSGGSAEDDWDIASVAFRSDARISKSETFAFLADGYREEEYLPVSVPSLNAPFVDADTYSSDSGNNGASASVRYENHLTDTDTAQLNFDYIFEDRNGDILPLTRHSLNGETLYETSLTESLGFVGGLGYRISVDETNGNFAEVLEPQSRTLHLYNGFMQFQQSLFDEEVRILAGTKLEYHTVGGFEPMPTARVLWAPTHTWSIWTAYSRAASTPGRVFDDLTLPLQTIPGQGGAPTAMVAAIGGEDMQSSVLNAYEIGVKRQLSSDVYVDLTGYYFDDNHVIGIESGEPYLGELEGTGPIPIVPLYFGNGYRASSYGSEASLDWAVSNGFSVSTFYSYFHANVQGGETGLESEELLKEGNSPAHTFGIRSHILLCEGLELDPNLRYVDSLKFGNIPGYWELGVRAAYRIRKNLELIVSGQDLLHDSHLENSGTVFSPPLTRIERSVWAELKLTL